MLSETFWNIILNTIPIFKILIQLNKEQCSLRLSQFSKRDNERKQGKVIKNKINLLTSIHIEFFLKVENSSLIYFSGSIQL
jgi:hypothetical protein